MNAATESCTTEAELANEGVVQPTSDSAQPPHILSNVFRKGIQTTNGSRMPSSA